MLINDYVILKSNRPRIRAIDNIGPGPMATPFDAGSDEIEVEHASLTSAERDDLRRDQNTRAVAPVLPMNLIKPTELSEVDATTLGAVTWGVAATKADVSAFDGNGITVAVLDTGIDPSHPAFTGVTLEQRNFTTEGNNDSHGHGTHCAGTIFGRDVNGLRIGVATGVQRALIGKVLGQGGGNSATIAEAIQWAVNEGAHVISMSLGIDFPGFVDTLTQHHGLAIEPATSIALEGYRANVNMFTELARFVRARASFAQGSIIVAASGNESNRPEFEIAVAPPAAGTGLLAVGALQEASGGLQVARFSNNQVDIAAPGVDVVSAKIGGGVQSMSGTSMATPHAAGIAALWGEEMLGQSGGRIDPQALVARVISSGSLQTLASGIETEDVGQGLVQAP